MLRVVIFIFIEVVLVLGDLVSFVNIQCTDPITNQTSVCTGLSAQYHLDLLNPSYAVTYNGYIDINRAYVNITPISISMSLSNITLSKLIYWTLNSQFRYNNQFTGYI